MFGLKPNCVASFFDIILSGLSPVAQSVFHAPPTFTINYTQTASISNIGLALFKMSAPHKYLVNQTVFGLLSRGMITICLGVLDSDIHRCAPLYNRMWLRQEQRKR